MSKSFAYILVVSCAITLLTFFLQDSENRDSQKPSIKITNSKSQTAYKSEQDELVGVYYMPSWNTSHDPAQDKDSFWSCITGKEDCSNLHNTAIWGAKGRIYDSKHPYEGPYLDRKPVKELKGFYKRADPEVMKTQLEMMKSYGIDFFAYDWFYGRHYYYHLYFGPQSKIYYPKNWKIDTNRDGRVAVPGMVEWADQLEVLLAENEKLPKEKQMKWALNWCDDSHERWMSWLSIGSPSELARKANYKGEAPTKELYLKVHQKITQLWIDDYFSRGDYLKEEDGRPVIYFYFPQDAESRAAFYGLELKDLLDLSQKIAKKSGLPGIKFIAVTSGPMLENERMYGLPTRWEATNPQRPWEGGSYKDKELLQEYVPRLKGMGFEGMTAYVYHNFMDRSNTSYAEMRKTYKGHWKMWGEKFKDDPDFEYQVPVAMGWDMRPAGGTWPQATGYPSEPAKDKVHSDKKSFSGMLRDAQKVSQKYRSSNGNTIMICCWNEYLEGNHIEPSEGHGYDYLEAIRDTF